jgi:hypothetical protein
MGLTAVSYKSRTWNDQSAFGSQWSILSWQIASASTLFSEAKIKSPASNRRFANYGARIILPKKNKPYH